jgi:hypothetical protein
MLLLLLLLMMMLKDPIPTVLGWRIPPPIQEQAQRTVRGKLCNKVAETIAHPTIRTYRYPGDGESVGVIGRIDDTAAAAAAARCVALRRSFCCRCRRHGRRRRQPELSQERLDAGDLVLELPELGPGRVRFARRRRHKVRALMFVR